MLRFTFLRRYFRNDFKQLETETTNGGSSIKTQHKNLKKPLSSKTFMYFPFLQRNKANSCLKDYV